MPFLQTDNLSLEDFIGFLHRYHGLAEQTFSEMPLLLAFSPAQVIFNMFTLDEPFFMASDQGRVFSSEAELKWRRVEERMHVVYLGNVPPPEGLQDHSQNIAQLTAIYSELILWGERTDTKNEWIEQQVPHRYHYSIRTSQYVRGRVAVIVEAWVDPFGVAHFSRYHSIKEIPGGNNAAG